MSEAKPSVPRFYSACEGGTCVEVAMFFDLVLVRDSKDPDGSILTFTRDEWGAFVDGVKEGKFDVG